MTLTTKIMSCENGDRSKLQKYIPKRLSKPIIDRLTKSVFATLAYTNHQALLDRYISIMAWIEYLIELYNSAGHAATIINKVN